MDYVVFPKAVMHDKFISYIGAIPLPGRLVEEACQSNSLNNYYIERRWRDPAATEKGFEYRFAMDPGNNHYYSWLKMQMTKRSLWETFRAMLNDSDNEERVADVVEGALGTLVIALRVPELEALIVSILPEGVTTERIFHSVGASIRAFRGANRGGRPRGSARVHRRETIHTGRSVSRSSTPLHCGNTGWLYLGPDRRDGQLGKRKQNLLRRLQAESEGSSSGPSIASAPSELRW